MSTHKPLSPQAEAVLSRIGDRWRATPRLGPAAAVWPSLLTLYSHGLVERRRLVDWGPWEWRRVS